MGSRARLNADPGRALFVIQRTLIYHRETTAAIGRKYRHSDREQSGAPDVYSPRHLAYAKPARHPTVKQPEKPYAVPLVRTLLGAAALSIAVGASAQMKPEDMIKTRQAGYAFMGWNMGKIKAQVVDGSVPFNKEQVQAAANLIAATANSGMGALYGPGTDEGTGWHETRLKPEFFKGAGRGRQDRQELHDAG